MRKAFYFSWLLCIALFSRAQKKPLDHSVYDGWQSIGERSISNDGGYVVYTVNPQEGDGRLIIQSALGTYHKEIPRGYGAVISEDSRFLICKIKPYYKAIREAKIKKKKPEDMPKDSLCILELGREDFLLKRPGVKSFKTPQKAGGWVAFLSEKGYPEIQMVKPAPDSLTRISQVTALADSLSHLADSLRSKVAEAREKGLSVLQKPKKENKKNTEDNREEGTELVLFNLNSGEQKKIMRVADYGFSKNASRLVVSVTRNNSDSLSKAMVCWMHLPDYHVDTVMAGLHDARNFEMDEDATQLAFVAERDSATKAIRKFYKLWYYKPGMDSARVLADASTPGVSAGMTVSEFFKPDFSKSGRRLFFGLAPIRPIKDTTQPDFEKAALDIWNYQDDDLQPVQWKNLERDLKKSYLSVLEPGKNLVLQLADEKFPEVDMTREGDGDVFYTSSDFGKRIQKQWQGYTLHDIYSIDPQTGQRKLIRKDLKGMIYPSATGQYLLIYDEKQKSYSIFNSHAQQLYRIAGDIKTPLFDEENDMPDDPRPYGIANWTESDKSVLIYDRYDVWKVDPLNKEKSVCLSAGRLKKNQYRYLVLDRDEKFIKDKQLLYFTVFNENTKKSGLASWELDWKGLMNPIMLSPNYYRGFEKAKDAQVLIFTKENYIQSPDLYWAKIESVPDPKTIAEGTKTIYRDSMTETKLSAINPQQAGYLWGTAELFKWKAYTGRESEGILYKPENFDPHQKYPMIVYFYERNNNTLYNYQPPSPTPSRLNIPFFVSRGYLVFVPDIWYKNGHPGKSAYDYIVSGTRALVKLGFVDSTKMGLQGQSWGGYQTAYLITQTPMFAAAWAGAPVVNMFSAYGGIRWESGLNRQMQYEHSQSRIGATPWERPDLYIENSPLFHLQNVKTPLVIMSNDADGAVPWYQGIEFFTDMRRLGKKVWLLQYNGEAHNLVERRNRKDIQIREQQFFDWLLKGEKAPVWIKTGVPATLKGISYGLETDK